MIHYRSEIIVSLFLIVITLAVYWPVQNYDFVNYDDYDYVSDNRYVKSGLTWEGIHWAFTTRLHGHWHPLTWLSHMTDYQLFGENPRWHHLISLLLHLANTLLLFLILQRATGAPLRSGFVAALFALHPLHVETVAWVADRKDVLSTFFWMLAMWAYVRYAERPGVKRYLPILVAFVLGLMAKPMVVTLPCVLLLMDYWPLGRVQFGQSIGGQSPKTHKLPSLGDQIKVVLRLIWEKVPLFLAAGALVLVTVVIRHQLRSLGPSPSQEWFAETIFANPLFAYMSYIYKMCWPVDLAVPYSKRDLLPLWQVGGTGVLLCLVSFLVFWRGRRHPYLPVGWLWYLGTLVPVIGLLQVGPHTIADRYTYVPLIGLFMMIAWGVPDILKTWRYRRVVLATSAGAVLLGLIILATLQLHHWQNTITLFTHTIDVNPESFVAHNNLGVALERQGKFKEAMSHYYEALRIEPEYEKARTNLGVVLHRQGRFDEAVAELTEALRMNPDSAETHNNLGATLEVQGRMEEAISHFYEALRINPGYSRAHYNLAVVLSKQGRLEEAINHYYAALRTRPDYAQAHNNLGNALKQQGRLEEAAKHFSEALRIQPDYVKARNNLEETLRLMGKSSSVDNLEGITRP